VPTTPDAKREEKQHPHLHGASAITTAKSVDKVDEQALGHDEEPSSIRPVDEVAGPGSCNNIGKKEHVVNRPRSTPLPVRRSISHARATPLGHGARGREHLAEEPQSEWTHRGAH